MSDSVGQYLNEIGMVPLLTADEERQLSQTIEKGVEAQARLDAGERGRELQGLSVPRVGQPHAAGVEEQAAQAARLAQVAAQSSVPIATGERLTTKYEFARVLEARAASIIQLNLGRAGGLLEGKKIAGIAEAFGAQIAPHCYNGPIGLAANIQLATCSPNFLIIESIRTLDGFHAELLRSPIEWADGRVIPPTAPGLGVELDEDVAEIGVHEFASKEADAKGGGAVRGGGAAHDGADHVVEDAHGGGHEVIIRREGLIGYRIEYDR